jgi:hypothetical protein
MKIKKGHAYATRMGRIETIDDVYKRGTYPVRGATGTYLRDGRYFQGRESAYDLVRDLGKTSVVKPKRTLAVHTVDDRLISVHGTFRRTSTVLLYYFGWLADWLGYDLEDGYASKPRGPYWKCRVVGKDKFKIGCQTFTRKQAQKLFYFLADFLGYEVVE